MSQLLNSRNLGTDAKLMLCKAAAGGDMVAVQSLVHSGVDVDVRDNGGRTPLMHAAAKGFEHVVEELLKQGAEVDLRDSCDCTASVHAAARGHYNLAHELARKEKRPALNICARASSIDSIDRETYLEIAREVLRVAERRSPDTYSSSDASTNQHQDIDSAMRSGHGSTMRAPLRTTSDSWVPPLREPMDGAIKRRQSWGGDGLVWYRNSKRQIQNHATTRPQMETICVFCGRKPRTSGVVHGRTFHKCYCLQCVKIAEKQNHLICPICLKKIDLFIEEAS